MKSALAPLLVILSFFHIAIGAQAPDTTAELLDSNSPDAITQRVNKSPDSASAIVSAIQENNRRPSPTYQPATAVALLEHEVASILDQIDEANSLREKAKEQDQNISQHAFYIVILGAFVLTVLGVLSWFEKLPFNGDQYVTAFGLVLVITSVSTVVLLIQADSQLAAYAGVMGTVAGYLFGAVRNPQPTGQDATTEPAQ